MPTGTGWNDEWMTSEGYGKIRQFSLEASRSKVSGFVAKIPGEVDKEDLQKSHITAKHREARRQPVPGIRPAAQIQGEEYRKNRVGKGSNFDFASMRNDMGRVGKYGEEYAKKKEVEAMGQTNLRGQQMKIQIKKDFYRETARTARRDPQEISDWRTKKEVVIDDPQCLIKPIFDFSELDVPSALTDLFRKNNYSVPTPIQAQSWPVSLRGQDTVGIARTGSGKTLSFLLPALVHIRAQAPLRRGDGPICLIMVPTRELAVQVYEEAKKFGTPMRIRTTAVFGGAPKNQQQQDLEAGCEMVVACPGRLLDFMQARTTNMNRCSFLILDEADRMLDMGFEPQIRKILQHTRKDRQTLMYSATWPKEVRRIAEDFMKTPNMITIGGSGEQLTANPNITQLVEVVEEYDKPVKYTKFLEKAYRSKIFKSITFVQQKATADLLAVELGKRGWPVAPLHGDKDQRQRDAVLRDFKRGAIPILIATDVAARGLDISDVEYVINYDFPHSIEDYVHRIGRTARGEKYGTAYTLLTKGVSHNIKQLIEVMEGAGQTVPKEVKELQNTSRNMAGAKARARRQIMQANSNRPSEEAFQEARNQNLISGMKPTQRPKSGSLSRRFNPY